MPTSTSLRSRESGQATVEFLAVVPLVFLLGWGVWQAALAGITAERAARIAHNAARAQAVGGAPANEVKRLLPKSLARSARITQTDSKVTVRLRVPSVIPGLQLGTVSATAAFPRQT